MAHLDDATNRKLSRIAATRGEQAAFAALVAVAVVVAIITSSMPVAVAVLAVGALALGGVFLSRARR